MKRVAVIAVCAIALGCSYGTRGRSLEVKRAAWLESWKKHRTYELGVEFLRLHGEANIREATLVVSTGGTTYSWVGKQAEIDMTTDQVEKMLGGADGGTDFTRDVMISETEMVRIEDMEAAGEEPGSAPVNVQVLELRGLIGGTGKVD